MDESSLSQPQAGPHTVTKVSQPAIKAGWLRGILFYFVFWICTIVLSIVLFTTLKIEVKSVADFVRLIDQPVMVFFQAVLLIAALLIVYIFRISVDRRSFVSLGFSLGSNERKDFLAGLIWGAGLISTVFFILLILGMVKVKNVQFPSESIIIAAIVIALVVLQEEIVTRGYLLNNFMTSMNKYLALLVISLLFAIIHGVNPNFSLIAWFNILLAGLLLGIYYVHRQNLWFPIGLHFIWNYFQGVVLGSPVSGLNVKSILTLNFSGNKLLTGGEFGFEASLVTTAVLFVAIVIINLKYRHRNRNLITH